VCLEPHFFRGFVDELCENLADLNVHILSPFDYITNVQKISISLQTLAHIGLPQSTKYQIRNPVNDKGEDENYGHSPGEVGDINQDLHKSRRRILYFRVQFNAFSANMHNPDQPDEDCHEQQKYVGD
jgi:hypothetical protein